MVTTKKALIINTMHSGFNQSTKLIHDPQHVLQQDAFHLLVNTIEINSWCAENNKMQDFLHWELFVWIVAASLDDKHKVTQTVITQIQRDITQH